MIRRANENASRVPREWPEFTQGIAVSRRTHFARAADLTDVRPDEIVAFLRPAGKAHRLWLTEKAEELNAVRRLATRH